MYMLPWKTYNLDSLTKFDPTNHPLPPYSTFRHFRASFNLKFTMEFVALSQFPQIHPWSVLQLPGFNEIRYLKPICPWIHSITPITHPLDDYEDEFHQNSLELGFLPSFRHGHFAIHKFGQFQAWNFSARG